MHRSLLLPLAAALLLPGLAAAEDTPAAAATRKKLQAPVTVEWKDTLLRDVLDELKDMVSGLGFRPDTKNGVNLNLKITYKAKDRPAADVLNEVCDRYALGYYVISRKGDAYDGSVRITRGKERGYEEGQAPDKATAATKDKPAPAAKEPAEKPKPAAAEKPEAKPAPAADDPEETERMAARRLRLAKELRGDGKADKAHEVLEDLVKKYPKTRAAEEAQKLLKDDK